MISCTFLRHSQQHPLLFIRPSFLLRSPRTSFHPVQSPLCPPFSSHRCPSSRPRRPRPRPLSCRPLHFHPVSMQAGPPSSPSGSGGPESGDPQPPDGATLTQALEISFRNVWVRLMTAGVGMEYNDAISAFVIATMAAYKAGYSISALKLELTANEKTNATFMGRDISLNEQEKQTRLIWIALVYLTLSKTKLVSERPVPSIEEEFSGTELDILISGLNVLVQSIFEAEAKGYNLETFKMELAMQKQIGQEQPFTQAQANIRSQWSRIVFVTLGILPESLKYR